AVNALATAMTTDLRTSDARTLNMMSLASRLTVLRRRLRRRRCDAHRFAVADRVAGIVDDSVGCIESRGNFDIRAEIAADGHRLQLHLVVLVDHGDRHAIRPEQQGADGHFERGMRG